MKIFLVYNTHAGHKRAKKILPAVESAFIEQNISFDLHLTDFPEHAVEIVRDADFSGFDGIVAAGGDGTLFEVINGYFQNPSGTRIPLGVLPVGTGNAFARDIGFDITDWGEAVRIIARNKPKNIDVGKFSSHGQDYYFLNIMGLGFVADVSKTAQRLKLLGNISYTLGVLFRTMFLKAFDLKIETDGKVLEQKNIFVEISNTRYTSNFLMAPEAKVDDGFLDVTLLRKITRRRLIQCFPKIFTGEHVLLDEIAHFKAKRISISTEVPKVLAPDGELVGITPVEVECLAGAVPVFWK